MPHFIFSPQQYDDELCTTVKSHSFPTRGRRRPVTGFKVALSSLNDKIVGFKLLGLPCSWVSVSAATLAAPLHSDFQDPSQILYGGLRDASETQGTTEPPYRLINGNTNGISKTPTRKNYLQWLGSRAQLVIREPELCRQILNNKDGAYLKIPPENFVKKLLGYGLVTIAEGQKWSNLRKISNHAFHGESLKTMIPDIIACAEIMLKRWESHEGKEIDVVEEFRLFTSKVISRTAFGSSYLEGQHIFEMLKKLALILFRNSLQIKVPGVSKLFKTNDEIESEKLEKGIQDSIIELVKKREHKVTSGEQDNFGSDFLGLLLKAHHNANLNQRISVDDIVDDCKTFYLAGQDTTSTLLTRTVFLLALNTDWQEEARKEVLQLFGKQNPNPDDISKLKTMSMILNESLRLYPPAVAIPRITGREVRLGKLIVPADVELLVSVLTLHHEPQFWGPDVHLFKPERFLEGVAKATNNNIGTFMPFGLGSRTCVGLNFATTEAKIALSMILQRYSFTLSPAYIHSPCQSLLLRPQHGLQVLLQPL
ncbi:hypothetical protein ACLB2K_033991 [Fragaria x ananassa]